MYLPCQGRENTNKLRTSSIKQGSLTFTTVKTPHQHEALFSPTFPRELGKKLTSFPRELWAHRSPNPFPIRARCLLQPCHSRCLPASSAPRAMQEHHAALGSQHTSHLSALHTGNHPTRREMKSRTQREHGTEAGLQAGNMGTQHTERRERPAPRSTAACAQSTSTHIRIC